MASTWRTTSKALAANTVLSDGWHAPATTNAISLIEERARALTARLNHLWKPNMNCAQATLKLSLAAVLALQLAACAKTVRWEEEVPLNTGETIWAKRTVSYYIQGGAGNPFDLAYRPDSFELIEFKWSGKSYRYEGDARIMVLAISPEKNPVLVAGAAAGAWDAKHNYKCVTPFYVQLIPDETGKNWTWPAQIETWLYNLPPNLMLQRKPPDEMAARFTAEQRQAADYLGSIQSESQQRINPSYIADHCKTRR